MIKVDLSLVEQMVSSVAFEHLWCRCEKAHETLIRGTGAGAEYLGWLTLPTAFDKGQLQRLRRAAEKICLESSVVVVVGIGGSYLGARALLELLQGPSHNSLYRNRPEIYFAGNSLSQRAWNELTNLIGDRDFSVIVISKSGTTLEPAVAFRLLRQLADERYGAKARERIYTVTDSAEGALCRLSIKEGYETFPIPGNIGGRYSVLSAVGLLPLAAAGIDIEALLQGAREMTSQLLRPGKDNPAWQYAAGRQLLYAMGRKIEVLAVYEPGARFFCEWFKQLFGESEGKDGKGIFPASAEFTADLHSLGQYLQEGERNLFETVLDFKGGAERTLIPEDPENIDGLNYLSGKTLEDIRTQALCGVSRAHAQGGVPSIIIQAPEISAQTAGALVCFFEFSCAISAYMLGVNPFNQPGVEAYKREMLSGLGKSNVCK